MTLKDFFASPDNKIINSILGDPHKTGTVTFVTFFLIVAIVFISIRLLADAILKRLAPNHWTTELVKVTSWKVIYELFTSPLKWSVNLSAFLLNDAIREHYQTSDTKKYYKKYALNVLGAVLISTISFSICWTILLLSTGISVETVEAFWSGDLDAKWTLIRGVSVRYFWLFTPILSLYIWAVNGKAKVTYLEDRYWDIRRVGLRAAIDLATWDETPKLNIPDDKLVKKAHTGVKNILAARTTDNIRVKAASGHQMFGSTGYLDEIIKRPNVTWRILLLNPDSEGAKNRAKSYLSPRASDPPAFKTEEDYLNGIRSTLDYLKQIKANHSNNISVRIYDHTPQWQIIISSGLAIVSGFGPGQRSDRAPISIFENTSTSMFHGFEEMFEDIWHNASNKYID